MVQPKACATQVTLRIPQIQVLVLHAQLASTRMPGATITAQTVPLAQSHSSRATSLWIVGATWAMQARTVDRVKPALLANTSQQTEVIRAQNAQRAPFQYVLARPTA